MNSMPPFIAQERSDACAMACLRMILAHQGKEVTEADIIQATDLQEGGLTPDEVSRLLALHGLPSTEKQLEQPELADLVKLGRFPIVFLFRAPSDGVDMTHAVIPVRILPQYITVLDPLRGERRLTIRKFEGQAFGWPVGRYLGACDRVVRLIARPTIMESGVACVGGLDDTPRAIAFKCGRLRLPGPSIAVVRGGCCRLLRPKPGSRSAGAAAAAFPRAGQANHFPLHERRPIPR
jgi:hypothetical protein